MVDGGFHRIHDAIQRLVFTGAAGKAFSNGLSVMMIFLGNALGYFFNYLFFAAKSRQVRVVTPIEGIRLRFGKVNEQVFT